MKYYIIAGEASGDLHGSKLIREIQRFDPQAEFRCWGGPLMQETGAALVRHYKDLAYMGFLEVLVHLRKIFQNIAFCQKDLEHYAPDAVILIDYPGFNLRIARFASLRGFPVFYYISPQVWAWKSSRVRSIKRYVNRMFVILPFEQEFYKKFDYPVEYVGHPLLDAIPGEPDESSRLRFLERYQLPDEPLIALLPGSRYQEIRAMLSVMAEVVPFFPGYQFVVGAAPAIPDELYTSILQGKKVQIIRVRTMELLRHAEAALVTSGTATLETALAGIPEVVCYKGNPVSFWLARRLVHIRFISLVNLILNRESVRELIQHLFNKENLTYELQQILRPEIRARLSKDYEKLREVLGGPGASARTAAQIVQYLSEKTV